MVLTCDLFTTPTSMVTDIQYAMNVIIKPLALVSGQFNWIRMHVATVRGECVMMQLV